jgi:hypothetical protein
LSIDPLLLPSIMSKKKAIGATHIVVDIPTGRGAKIKTIGEPFDPNKHEAVLWVQMEGKEGIYCRHEENLSRCHN